MLSKLFKRKTSNEKFLVEVEKYKKRLLSEKMQLEFDMAVLKASIERNKFLLEDLGRSCIPKLQSIAKEARGSEVFPEEVAK